MTFCLKGGICNDIKKQQNERKFHFESEIFIKNASQSSRIGYYTNNTSTMKLNCVHRGLSFCMAKADFLFFIFLQMPA